MIFNILIGYLLDIRILLSFVVIYLIYQYGKMNQNLHKRIGKKGPKPVPFFGNFLQMFKGIHYYDLENVKKYGKIYPIYLGAHPMIIVADPEVLKSILIKDARSFIDRFDLGGEKSTKSFLTRLKGKDWERVRSIISPTFTSGKLKKMSPMIQICVHQLEEKIASMEQESSIDMKEAFGALTMDVISCTMFGIKIDSQTNPENKFILNAKKLFNFSLFRFAVILLLLFPKFAKLLSWLNIRNTRLLESIDFFRNSVEKVIEERKKSNEEHNDFLSLMLKEEAAEEEEQPGKELTEKKLSMDEILAQSMIFLLAGYETTATTLTFTAYFLAKNPQTQEEVYNELVDTVQSEEEINYDTLMKMPLLDAAINETLRICPPAVQLNRQCTEPCVLKASDGSVLNACVGDIFTVPIFAIHHDPELWPEPDKYDIHRFDSDQKNNRNPYSYMPFGMGPRNCVGMRFALLEVKWALACLLFKFQFLECAETPAKLEFKPGGLISPKEPIKLKILSRN